MTALVRQGAGLARVGLFLSIVVSTVALAWAHHATARLDQTLLQWGETLLQQQPTSRHSSVRSLRINGALFHLTSGISPMTVPELLDMQMGECGPSVTPILMERPAEGELSTQSLRGASWRTEEQGRGFVTCLAQEGPTEPLGELDDLGQLRYLYARETDRGTHFVALRTEGSVPIDRMFPERGDAPGRDLPGIPRPTGSRRFLSVFQEERHEAYVVYEVPRGSTPPAEHYREQLSRRGWNLLYNDREDNLVFERGQELLTIVIDSQRPGLPLVTVVAM